VSPGTLHHFGLGPTPVMPPSNISMHPSTPGGPMTPISPAPLSEGSGIVPTLQ